MSTMATGRADRFVELDSLRAIAALGVICWHYRYNFNAAPFDHVLAPFYSRGLLMVDFFFVLSGFVLCKAFWNERKALHFGTNVLARLGRLYPLHITTLCAVAAMQWYLTSRLGMAPFIYAHNNGYHFALNMLMLNASGLQHGFSFNAPSWSISTEFLVNLLFLGLITAPFRLARIAMAAIGCAAAITLVQRGLINGTRAFGWIDNDLIRTAAGFFVGVMAYKLHSWRQASAPSSIWDVITLLLIAIALSYLATSTFWGNTGDMLVCLVVFPLVIYSVLRGRFVKMALQIKPLVYLGTISYSIYLVHFPLMLAIHIATTAGVVAPHYGSRWFFTLFIGIVIAIASLSYRVIELPCKKWMARHTARGMMPLAVTLAP